MVRDHAVEKGRGLLARHKKLTHVRDVEEPRSVPHRQVLAHLAGVADRHLETGELDQFRARAAVEIVEGGVLEGLDALHVGSLDRKAHAS